MITMLKSINHIGIAVKDLEKSKELFRKIFGVENFHSEKVEAQKVEVASFSLGGIIVELTAPTDESSPIARFIGKKGEGIHHIAFETENIEEELARLKKEEIQLVNETAQVGAHDMLIAFLHPKSTNNVLMEICQKREK